MPAAWSMPRWHSWASRSQFHVGRIEIKVTVKYSWKIVLKSQGWWPNELINVNCNSCSEIIVDHLSVWHSRQACQTFRRHNIARSSCFCEIGGRLYLIPLCQNYVYKLTSYNPNNFSFALETSRCLIADKKLSINQLNRNSLIKIHT